MNRLTAIPPGCDCAWSVYEADGRKAGSVFVAGEKCMAGRMHPRTFSEGQDQ